MLSNDVEDSEELKKTIELKNNKEVKISSSNEN